MNFTFDSLKLLNDKILLNKFDYSFFDQSTRLSKTVYIRHDIDFSLEKAKEMADFEYFNGIKATYFFLLSSPFYNLLNPISLEYIFYIQSKGHQIGLHFDESVYGNLDINTLIGKIKIEIDILSKLIQKQINVISMHRPSKRILDSNITFDNIINTYSNKFFNEIMYVSDSRRKWKINPIHLFNDKSITKLQILIHPIWYHEKELTLKDTLNTFVNINLNKVYISMDNNFTQFRNAIESEE
jgi:hypothetical protein